MRREKKNRTQGKTSLCNRFENRHSRRLLARQTLAIALAIMVGVTFLPLLEPGVHAVEQDHAKAGRTACISDTAPNAYAGIAAASLCADSSVGGTVVGETVSDAQGAAALAGEADLQKSDDAILDEIIEEDIPGEFALEELDPSDLDIDVSAEDGSEAAETPPADASVPDQVVSDRPSGMKTAGKTLANALQATNKGATASDAAGGITLTPNDSTGELTVTGSVTGDTFKTLAVYDSSNRFVGSMSVSGNSFSQVFDMSVLPIGVYVIAAQTTSGRTYADAAFSLIYDKPSHKLSQYEVYSKYLFYKPKTTYYRSDSDCGLYLDIKAKGAKKWTTYGPLSSSANTIEKLKPNKTYKVRTYYGKNITVSGTTYLISGLWNKKYKTLTIKTGKKKLPIKSVTVKAVNVKKHTHIIPGYVLNNVGKETWYTYRLKVTVKMKKKPGIKALYINGKKVKGNKKTYSVKFAKQNSIYTGKWVVKPYRKYYKHTIAKIPRGTKYVVKLYSYRNKTYKGYSNIQTRTKKIR